MVRVTDHLNMSIATDWDIKQQAKLTKQWTIPNVLYKTRKKNLSVHKGLKQGWKFFNLGYYKIFEIQIYSTDNIEQIKMEPFLV